MTLKTSGLYYFIILDIGSSLKRSPVRECFALSSAAFALRYLSSVKGPVAGDKLLVGIHSRATLILWSGFRLQFLE